MRANTTHATNTVMSLPNVLVRCCCKMRSVQFTLSKIEAPCNGNRH